MTISDALAIAFQHHQSGRLPEAEGIYREILAVDPNQPETLHLLGVLAHQTGHPETAAELISRASALRPGEALFASNLSDVLRTLGRREEALAAGRKAVALDPAMPAAHNNLGNALHDQGQLPEAIAAFGAAIQLQADNADAYNNLGNALKDQGRLEEAVAAYLQALALRPNFARAHNNLGTAYKDQGKLAEAAHCIGRALELEPRFAEAHANLGLVFKAQGKLDQALACFQRGLEIDPRSADMNLNLGLALMDKDEIAAAARSYRRALELKPDFAGAHNNLGNAYRFQGRPEEAMACFRRALEIEPDFARAHTNMGVAAMDRGEPAEALPWLRRAVELEPDLVEANHNLALTLLQLERYAEGWRQYEWRRALLPARDFPAPRWNEASAVGHTLLVHCEQGFGDSFQFLRYALLARERARAGRVILECQPELARLLAKNLAPEIAVVAGDGSQNAALPPFDRQLPLLSLPAAFRIDEPLPMSEPYLHADPDLRATWRERLGPGAGLRVGLVWSGNRTHPLLRLRSMEGQKLLPLLRQPDVTFYSLTVHAKPHEVKPLTESGLIDLTDSIDDFADTAALMAELDLIISIDTAAAHLAGALGRPVWTLLQHVSDWRWGLTGETTPWYPTMRLFRQAKPRDWDSVLGCVGKALSDYD